jgi:hypothetical protein
VIKEYSDKRRQENHFLSCIFIVFAGLAELKVQSLKNILKTVLNDKTS